MFLNIFDKENTLFNHQILILALKNKVLFALIIFILIMVFVHNGLLKMKK